MNKYILSSIISSLLFVNLSFAQSVNQKTKILTVDEVENKKSKKFDSNETRVFSNEEIQIMDALIVKKDFSNLYDYLRNVKVSSKSYISYLESKRDLGIPPLYWLMADYYSFQPNAIEATHFWTSVAVIMTSQDTALCKDNTARYAVQKMIQSFPNPQSVISKTPAYIDISMPKVKFFISNIKTRITPEWSCVFGEHYIKFKDNLLISKTDWDNQRDEIFKKFTSKYGN